MAKHINAAQRVYKILSLACELRGNEPTWQVFAKVFDVQNANGRKVIFEVHRMLDLFYDEIEKVKTQMRQSDFSEDLYEPSFKIIEERISPGLVFNPWDGYKVAIQSTLQTIKFCSEVLPNEEPATNEDDFDEIEEAIQELEALLAKSDLPDEAKIFIREHIDIIKKALRDYQVIGARAFKSAMYQGYVHYAENEEVVNRYEQTEEIGLLSRAWGGLKKVASATLGNDKLLTAGTKLAELGMHIAEHIDKAQPK
jgi:hypothetical protein